MYKLLLRMLSVMLVVSLITINCGQKQYDILILNGSVIDGSGKKAFQSDIGISGDKIIALGDLKDESASTIIDADGLVVAPGFIDIHTHCDRGILKMPDNENYIYQGVTTVVGGNCGGSPGNLKEFFSEVKEVRPSTNIAVLVGHNTVRREAMGLSDREPTDEELSKMKLLVKQAMQDGAIGLSTGLGYTPGMYSKTEEIIELNKVIGEYGGIYASHIRDQGLKMYDSVEEAIRIGEEGGTRVQISHLKLSIDKYWGEADKLAKIVQDARDRGLEVYTDQYPYIAASTSLTIIFPAWSLADGKLKERLQYPGLREKIKKEVFTFGRMKTYRHRDMLSVIQICSYKPDPSFEGKNLRQILEMRGIQPTRDNAVELAIEIIENGGASCVFFFMDEGDVADIMKQQYNMIASDGSVIQYGKGVPHPRSYGTFPRVLGKYIRNDNIMPLETAIYKMTSLPAQSLRYTDRGLIEVGKKADIVVFDKEEISDKATFQAPHQFSVGVNYVIVNGTLTVKDGKLTGKRSGLPLYGPGLHK